MEHANADSLQCLPLAEDTDTVADTDANTTVFLIGGLPLTASYTAKATAKDPILMRMDQYVLKGRWNR